MIELFIDILQCLGIEYVIAPYEADAQMAFMVREGIADFAVTEDSDLIAYGCPKTVLKLSLNTRCQVFSTEDFMQNQKITDKSLLAVQKMSKVTFL